MLHQSLVLEPALAVLLSASSLPSLLALAMATKEGFSRHKDRKELPLMPPSRLYSAPLYPPEMV
jgi:hypothetical protein